MHLHRRDKCNLLQLCQIHESDELSGVFSLRRVLRWNGIIPSFCVHPIQPAAAATAQPTTAATFTTPATFATVTTPNATKFPKRTTISTASVTASTSTQPAASATKPSTLSTKS